MTGRTWPASIIAARVARSAPFSFVTNTTSRSRTNGSSMTAARMRSTPAIRPDPSLSTSVPPRTSARRSRRGDAVPASWRITSYRSPVALTSVRVWSRTWSAPIDRTRSRLDGPQTPVTSAPSALAICTAKVPTPPDAPITSTRCPARTRPWSRSPWRAVMPASGTAAAPSSARSAGRRTSWSAGTHTSSASDPAVNPNTSSPARRSVTVGPVPSTTPARSMPGMGLRGRRRPVAKRTKNGAPRTACQSPAKIDAARTRTSTSPGPGSGRGSSSRVSVSGAPYRRWTIAFTGGPP